MLNAPRYPSSSDQYVWARASAKPAARKRSRMSQPISWVSAPASAGSRPAGRGSRSIPRHRGGAVQWNGTVNTQPAPRHQHPPQFAERRLQGRNMVQVVGADGEMEVAGSAFMPVHRAPRRPRRGRGAMRLTPPPAAAIRRSAAPAGPNSSTRDHDLRPATDSRKCSSARKRLLSRSSQPQTISSRQFGTGARPADLTPAGPAGEATGPQTGGAGALARDRCLRARQAALIQVAGVERTGPRAGIPRIRRRTGTWPSVEIGRGGLCLTSSCRAAAARG